MQQLWTLQIDWTERLPEKEASEWKEFVRSLVALNGINIERCIVIPNTEVIELHGFCDASEKAYGRAIYDKSINPDREIKVQLVASKSRLSPIKQVTMPLLEFSAFLLAKLMHKGKRAFKMDIISVFFWTDSTIVLKWRAVC
ncbi:integrase_H2C2 domain-containing protein [Trichonephila clavipes]|uniref:Integrase_H2C2 domain-containing protein n=1 Tax=Trichonephila clavipes TaxID=2585209 RepID=A0A8X6VFJ4_TRICX|nr:integrase_H2C2 domain-containing protein [Trichonephila clavipes]